MVAALLASIEPDRNGFPRANTLAYFASLSVTERKTPTLVLAALVASIAPGRKGFPETNALAYFASSLVTERKS